MLRVVLASVVVAGGALFVACGDDDDGGDAGGGPTTIEITLQEFEVLADAESGPAGDFSFDITNVGPDDIHEFVVVKTDLAPNALPTGEDGSVDEEGEGIEPIDEIEDIPVDANETLDVTLNAGSYVLFCNIVDEVDGEAEVHYQLGMRTAFTVE